MNFEDIKERFISSFKQLWDRIQDSSLHNQLRDRYENLTPRAQKGVIVAAAALFSLFVLSFPFGYWSDSQVAIEGFENRRDLVRKLLKTTREAADVPDIPTAPSPESLRAEIDSSLRSFQLVPEQIRSLEVNMGESAIIPSGMAQGGVTVSLAKLNIRQIVDIGYRLKAINPSVKMTTLQISPNREDARYFDVLFKLVSLAVPEMSAPPPPEAEEPPSRGNRPSFRRNRNTDEN